MPELYKKRMMEMLGPEGFAAYLESFQEKQQSGLRLNTSKVSCPEFLRMSPLSLSPIPWIPNGFYCQEEERPAKDPYYYAGLYYLQEPSAMTPASLLPVRPGNRVLDLCAAPGGKSTELGLKLAGEGFLLANDISNSRAKALLKNLELWGIPNICVTSEEPEKLKDAFGEYFDRILVDAPCSGEGMFRKDGDMIKSYEEHGPEYYAPIQEEIMDQAVGLLAPGGLLLYSTCTFSICEDEDVVRHTLKRHPELELEPLELFEGASEGFGLPGVIRLFPHKIRGEGHFMALLRKKGREAGGTAVGSNGTFQKGNTPKCGKLPQELEEFLKLIHRGFDPARIAVKNDCVYYLPDAALPKNLRYLRTGLLLGELKKGRFEPGQALAMNLRAREFGQTVSFGRNDERVLRYLKGETIALYDGEIPVKGWCLVCVDDFPLGFAKGMGMTLKNKYYPGWRWQ